MSGELDYSKPPEHYAALWADDTGVPHDHPDWKAAYSENLGDLQKEYASRPQSMPQRNLNQTQFSPLFHGSPYSREPGDTIDPGHKAIHSMSRPGYTYATHSGEAAARWAKGGNMGRAKSPHVYEVEPTGEYGDDPGSFGGIRSSSPLRVKREVPIDKAKKIRAPSEPSRPPGYIGRDSNYRKDQELFDRKWNGS